MNVYLDNNVLVDIEEGKYSLVAFLSKQDTKYHYSDVHLNELLEARGIDHVSQEERLALISKICGENYIVTGVLDPPEFLQKDVSFTYRLCDTPYRVLINKMACNDAPYEKVRQQLGITSRDFNNTSPNQVLFKIDCMMKEKVGISLMSFLVSSEAFGGKPLFYTLLKLIDISNYWPDKKTDHSGIALLNDAAHAYSAQICDMLVTNDRRMKEKVTAIYMFLGINTAIVSTDDYLSR